MGWANCGEDSEGRPIGYGHEATCDHPGCQQRIHRGLAYACGDMHGDNEVDCDRYFCEAHRGNRVMTGTGPLGLSSGVLVCDECAARLLASGEWREDDEEGIVRVLETPTP